jgi:hypothetical protein
LGQEERLVVGMMFYKKNGAEWEKFIEPDYYEKTYTVQLDGKNNIKHDVGYVSNAYGDDFYISHSERFTLIK